MRNLYASIRVSEISKISNKLTVCEFFTSLFTFVAATVDLFCELQLKILIYVDELLDLNFFAD